MLVLLASSLAILPCDRLSGQPVFTNGLCTCVPSAVPAQDTFSAACVLPNAVGALVAVSAELRIDFELCTQSPEVGVFFRPSNGTEWRSLGMASYDQAFESSLPFEPPEELKALSGTADAWDRLDVKVKTRFAMTGTPEHTYILVSIDLCGQVVVPFLGPTGPVVCSQQIPGLLPDVLNRVPRSITLDDISLGDFCPDPPSPPNAPPRPPPPLLTSGQQLGERIGLAVATTVLGGVAMAVALCVVGSYARRWWRARELSVPPCTLAAERSMRPPQLVQELAETPSVTEDTSVQGAPMPQVDDRSAASLHT